MAESTSAAPPATPLTNSALSSDESEGEATKAETQVDYFNAKLDDQDEAWAANQRKGRKSDAILTCPACFTTLCIDCQRHEKYVHQYRAMFVTNCRIVENERLRMPPLRGGKGRRRRRKAAAALSVEEMPEMESGEEIFKPVRCSVCDTEVAVFDKDEVYHFFNIVPSYS